MRRCATTLLVTWMAAANAFGAEQSSASFAKDVRPLLQKYCISCHGGARPKADLSLEKYTDETSVVNDRDMWDAIADQLQSRSMPPEGKPQPTAAEFSLMTGWITATLQRVDCADGINPGRVTVRRLNRAEYNNTIRDLLGVDVRPADEFPLDDSGYGFDTIGDVLSISPILMERYLAAAEKVVKIAMNGPSNGKTVSLVKANQFSGGNGGSAGYRTLSSNGEITASISVPADAEYLLRIRAHETPAGTERAKMKLRVDNKDIYTFRVQAREDFPGVYERSVSLKKGNHTIGLAFLNDFFDPDTKRADRRDRNLMVHQVEAIDPKFEEIPESYRRLMIAQPSATVTKTEAARKILRNFARRAFRRPVEPEEVDRLLEIAGMAFKEGDDFNQAVGVAIQAALVSPHFLFRPEIDDPKQKGSHRISHFELASRLSYFLWSSMPDDELFSLADEGTLHDPAVLSRQVARMLQDTRARALVENFGGQWLETRKVEIVTPDRRLFPSFNRSLRSAMKEETERYFWEITSQNRSILEFLDSDYTFVNDRLARHYGLPNVDGPEFRKVSLQGGRRGGILTQGTFLTITSNPTRTSPVKRGKWVLEQVLGTPPPPPPPNVPELTENNAQLTGTLRQRMEQHRKDPNCASCHQRMDPIGFGLENYDAIGAWRERDAGAPIEPAGKLPSGESFDGPEQLKKVLQEHKDLFVRCLAEKMLTYALGRGTEYYDRCAVDEIVKATEKADYRFQALILAVVQSEPFQRKAVEPKP